jgi:uncharacterized repeat protein (TIGR03803 family)
MLKRRSSVIFALLVAGVPAPAFADYTFTTLASFNNTNGAEPVSLIISGSTIYGTTGQGGDLSQAAGIGAGAVFSVPVSGGTPTLLASFRSVPLGLDSDGVYPNGVILSGDTLYGTTNRGGAFDLGTVFSVPAIGGTLTTLVDFSRYSQLGAAPGTGLVLSGSNLYGTLDYGAIFSVPVSGGAPTILSSFNYQSFFAIPNSLILYGNTFYGSTQYGGPNQEGTVYSVPLGGGTATVLITFDGTNGVYPRGLILSGRTLYGATAADSVSDDGSTNGDGTVFSIPVDGGTPTTLLDFGLSDLILSGNTLYGLESQDFGEILTLVWVPVDGGTPTMLGTFDVGEGNGISDLILSGNTFYGTTYWGGDYGAGSVFELSPTTLPEPSILGMLAIGGLLLGRRHRQARRRRAWGQIKGTNKSDANLYLKSGIRNTALPQPGKGRGRLSMLRLDANYLGWFADPLLSLNHNPFPPGNFQDQSGVIGFPFVFTAANRLH